jgi:nucleoside-diphosphate-sugar epimerase
VKDDIRNASSWDLRGIDVVLHLANVANDPCAELDSKLNWEVNALATMFLVERAIRDGVPHFIFASSGSVYGVKEEPEVTEELSLVPISDYNKTKMISERVLLSYADQIRAVIVRPATVCGYSPRMRLDLSVNMLTMQALTKGKITVFGGDQTRPNIHLRDMIRLYEHFLAHPELRGVFNAGFENISILDIAERAKKHVPAEVIVTPSNDPRSYRLSSKKLLATGFQPKYGVEDGIQEVIEAYRGGKLQDREENYNIRTMKKLGSLA